MANNRKAIREAVKAILSGNTSVGSNVYTSRNEPLWESELPAILVSTGDEEATPRDNSGRQYIRTLTLTIEIKAEGNATVDDDLDDLANEVETIIVANNSLNATAIAAKYKSTSKTLDAESETEKGVATLTYEVQYIG